MVDFCHMCRLFFYLGTFVNVFQFVDLFTFVTVTHGLLWLQLMSRPSGIYNVHLYCACTLPKGGRKTFNKLEGNR